MKKDSNKKEFLSKNNKKKLTQLVLIIIIPIILILFENNIKRWWDEAREIKPDVYISLNQIVAIKSDILLDLSDNQKKKMFLQSVEEDFKSKGLIPLPLTDSQVYTVYGVKDEPYCIIPFFEVKNESRKFPLPFPGDELKDLCIGCLLNIVYGINIGKKTVDYVNVKIDFDSSINVNKDIKSNDLQTCGNYCIRLKRDKIVNEESSLGSFTITKDNTDIFDDNTVKKITGIYSAWGIEENIPESHINKILSFVIVNCIANS